MLKTTRTKIRKSSSLETGFLRLWLMHGKGPGPVTEFKFHPVREWRFDFAWPAKRVAVEIHGGVHSRGRHVRGYGIVADCRKMNSAVLRGWAILVYTGDDLKERPTRVIEEVNEVLATRV